MKLIIGSYRGPEMVDRCLDSVYEHLHGVTQIVIVEDSGNDSWCDYYRNRSMRVKAPLTAETLFGLDIEIECISMDRFGYNAAMKVVCENAGGARFMFLEEDFVFTEDVDLNTMEYILTGAPHLAQLALLRGPHFDNEKLLASAKGIGPEGAVLAGLQQRLPQTVIDTQEISGFEVIVQDGTFTCNPSVWQLGVSSRGWPDGRWSEDRMRDQLLDKGYLFGFLPGVKVEHDGVRSGFGY